MPHTYQINIHMIAIHILFLQRIKLFHMLYIYIYILFYTKYFKNQNAKYVICLPNM